MKTQGTPYNLHLKNYQTWLQRQGYAEGTIYGHGKYLRSFFNWLQSQNLTSLQQVSPLHISQYQQYLESRPKLRGMGALSSSMIYCYLTMLKIFDKYLRQYGHGSLPLDHLRLIDPVCLPKEILTEQEILQLYEATDNTPYGYRDRAVLALCYGCGLRRSEAANLHCDDIDWDRKYLHIRKGKGAKARYVPFNDHVSSTLKEYYQNYRTMFLRDNTPLFLLGNGGRMQGGSMNRRLKEIAARTAIEKPVYLHLLRHSIATHLLHKGMDIEQIASFLGHSTLEATQMYTHIEEGYTIKDNI